MDKYDLIVIGAGNGGLMTACRAAQLGLKVLVVERHNMPGGAATSFVGGRFDFDASLHEIPDFGQGASRGELGRLFDELGIQADMLPIKDAFRYVVEKDGVRSLDVTFPHGKDEVMKLISEICPDDVQAMENFFDAYEDMNKGLAYFGSVRGNVDPQVLIRDYPDFMKIMSMSAGELFRTLGMSEKCQKIMSAYWPYQGTDIDTVDASRYLMMVYGYFVNGAYVPRMRSHSLSAAIVKRATEFGCHFLFAKEVTKVLTDKGRVCGVQLDDGRIFETKAIAANTYPEIVYSKLLDNPSLVPAFELKKANARKYGFRAFSVYLGLDAPPEEIGVKDYTVFISTTADSRVICDESATRFGKEFALDVCCLNIAIPDCTPEGTTEMVLTISYTDDAWADVSEEDYMKTKRQVADQMISDLERIMGYKIREHIEEIEIASPVTFARYMYSPQGSIYGYSSLKWDGMSSRLITAGMEQTVPGLFFVGGHGSSLSGYFPTYTNGSKTAFQIMGYVRGGAGR
ncbi:MAG: NAD(P)/FAD-dependent oxidoreductase [Erysipelotrichaceae bacterium]|nr:NAD(P)/FAD-dependent oxidoreductase [Erysipelotrichaceae bacterium]